MRGAVLHSTHVFHVVHRDKITVYVIKYSVRYSIKIFSTATDAKNLTSKSNVKKRCKERITEQTLRRVDKNNFDVEKQCVTYLCVSVGVYLHTCSLNYPACNAPPYCLLGAIWHHQAFRHYLINDTIVRKILLNIKCVF